MITKDCPHCDKKIEGFTEKQAEHLLNQHIMARHKDKVRFKK